MSTVSVGWTVVSGALAIALGIHDDSAVLVAFGAVGVVDAVGSAALVHHFRHGLKHDELSDRFERRAHRIVLVGMAAVGVAAVVGGVTRLLFGVETEGTVAGAVLAAISLVVLLELSSRKRRIGRSILSHALVSDGHLSGIGALQAAVALAGTVATGVFGWDWADASATAVVGGGAIVLAVQSARDRDA